MTLDTQQLARRIVKHYSQPDACLFAGAGVSARAGMPTWSSYIEQLAIVAEQYEPETASLMRKRAANGQFLEAAQLYKTCTEIPRGVMFERLVEPFLSYDATKLRALVSLPNAAIVTTNFDRSLHDAYQGLSSTATRPRHAALSAELHDTSLQQATYWKDFFIARIHGRVEIPTTVVIASEDYIRTESDPHYQDFVVHVFKAYRCLWLGYSFIDPAIRRIFEVLRRTLVQPYPRLHIALLPSDADARLRAELHEFNIETLIYDAADHHASLWDAVKLANRELHDSQTPATTPGRGGTLPGLQPLVASAYARLRLGRGVQPLTEVVTQGIIAQSVTDAGSNGVTRAELHAAVRRHISLSDSEVTPLVDSALAALTRDGQYEQKEDHLTLVGTPPASAFDEAINKLTDATLDRLRVREGVAGTDADRLLISRVIPNLIMSRGWDLGAHFARSGDADAFDAWHDIEAALARAVAQQSGNRIRAIQFAIFDVLRHPNSSESEVLADLGRIAFAVELVTSNSRSVIAQAPLLPEIIYLDANVLLPAIVPGHPYQRLYSDTLQRVQSAAAGVGRAVHLVVGTDFIGEILRHKDIATALVRDSKLEDPVRLQQHILFYGAHRTNVYIAAYASRVGRQTDRVSFEAFCDDIAPYNGTDTLVRFLRQQGISVETFAFSGVEQRTFGEISDALHSAYAAEQATKPDVLIDHEAKQLTRLVLDLDARRGSLFVTADKALMGYCVDRPLGRCANAMISHLGFIQLVDVLLGVATDRAALTRLLWNVGKSDPRVMIRNFLIDRALSYYDEAKAMAVWEVIDRIADRAAQEAADHGVHLFFRASELPRNDAFLDRFEEIFYREMKAVIDERANIDK